MPAQLTECGELVVDFPCACDVELDEEVHQCIGLAVVPLLVDLLADFGHDMIIGETITVVGFALVFPSICVP